MCEDQMSWTNDQLETVAFIIKAGMSRMDNECVKSIETIHELARENYAVSIWSGVVGRQAKYIAEQTEGAVVIKTAKQREQLAAFLLQNNAGTKNRCCACNEELKDKGEAFCSLCTSEKRWSA